MAKGGLGELPAKILVVDDEPNLLRLIRYALEGEGYEVTTAENGVQALKAVETGRPDLLVLDVMLPDMSGLEVCQRVRSLPGGGELPIVMLSALTQLGDRVRGLQSGADDYIPKPSEVEEVAARVRALLEHGPRTQA